MDLVPYIFHEQQEGNLCAQHCLNALLQGPYFTAIDLAELARQLDQKEQDALGNTGSRFYPVKSQNMDDSGFFSVQVLSHALTIWNIQIIPWGSKEVSDAKAEPERETAFICNLNEHWYTLRRFGPSTQRWYDLNSMHSQPRHMSATYLGMTLSQLEAEGYSIFVVRPLNKQETTTAAATGSTVLKSSASIPSMASEQTIGTTNISPLSGSISSSSTTTTTTTTTTTAAATGPSSFLSERQEMERIRRQRIEERERAAQQKSDPSLSAISGQNNNSKRARVDDSDESKDAKRSSKDVLVTTPSFLPRSEADEMAATLPVMVESSIGTAGSESSQKQQQQQAFGGTGYRLGESAAGDSSNDGSTDISSLPPGYSLEDVVDENDPDWEMMQQAIEMSLQGSR
ncbi:Ataxin-3 [Lobosporangium transversale]|uniref:Ataxin-3 homolog n=1 Tax=Lobosporangium transversale TaxID=64571 RepID=A0A1Y2GXP4_9FUNG|nr:Josephin-domain-containing protein [Lobosporangium transversale]KAF9914987.1 Ataxin-3 [Lobosporangium transversale]ORZ27025.1 Josephin-domain-containing protein [Lobosporangium transversale]|eukprot:XP_021884772.1 Josephin-domain-containing protein [Lobosporangium transversale]